MRIAEVYQMETVLWAISAKVAAFFVYRLEIFRESMSDTSKLSKKRHPSPGNSTTAKILLRVQKEKSDGHTVVFRKIPRRGSGSN